jgi:hypothetical protein
MKVDSGISMEKISPVSNSIDLARRRLSLSTHLLGRKYECRCTEPIGCQAAPLGFHADYRRINRLCPSLTPSRIPGTPGLQHPHSNDLDTPASGVRVATGTDAHPRPTQRKSRQGQRVRGSQTGKPAHSRWATWRAGVFHSRFIQ